MAIQLNLVFKNNKSPIEIKIFISTLKTMMEILISKFRVKRFGPIKNLNYTYTHENKFARDSPGQS